MFDNQIITVNTIVTKLANLLKSIKRRFEICPVRSAIKRITLSNPFLFYLSLYSAV